MDTSLSWPAKALPKESPRELTRDPREVSGSPADGESGQEARASRRRRSYGEPSLPARAQPRRACPSCPGRRRLRAGRPRAASEGRSARALLARAPSIICQHLSCSRIFPRYTASRVIPAEGPPSIPRRATTLESPGPAASVFTSPHLIIYL